MHDLFISACGNQVLREVLHSLRVTMKLFEIERLTERLDPDLRQHEEILDALKAGAAVVAHLRSLFDFAIRVI